MSKEELTKKEQELAQNIGLGIAILIFAVLTYLRFKGVIAGPDKIVLWLQGWYQDYGLWVVLISAFLEGLFVINLYFPGSTAILLGVAFARRNDQSVPLFVLLAIIGAFTAYIVNYLLGRYGLHKVLTRFGYADTLQEMEQSLREKGPRIMLSSFFHPNVAVLVTTGAGLIKMKWRQFLFWTILSLTLWYIFWGIVVYFVGDAVIELLTSWLALPAMAAWALLVYFFLPRKKAQKA